jgi:hypothetical protein
MIKILTHKDVWNLRFFWHLVLEIWDLNEFILEKIDLEKHFVFCKSHKGHGTSQYLRRP